jgi:hypothetical protein
MEIPEGYIIIYNYILVETSTQWETRQREDRRTTDYLYYFATKISTHRVT